MSEKETGGPAFPLPAGGALHDGLTMRDYFAAKAMQTYANSEVSDIGVSRASYRLADAMLKARAE